MYRVNNFFIAISIVALMALTSTFAHASFLIEPHLGYNLSSSTTYKTDALKYSGIQYGSRLGFQYFGVMGGVDYTRAVYTLKTTGQGSTTTDGDDKSRNELGVFVGYKFPVMVRAWVSYNFSTKETQDKTGPNGDAGDYLKGHSTEIGIGFTGLPFVSLNISYRMLSYDTKYESVAKTTKVYNPTYEPKEIVLGISAPFTLL